MNKRRIGQKIRALRESRGLTQELLSAKAHIANRALQRIEAGSSESNPTLDTLESIASFFKVSVVELIGDENTSIQSLIDRRTELAEVVDQILKLADVSPDKRCLVMALVSEDPKHLQLADPALVLHAKALLKAL